MKKLSMLMAAVALVAAGCDPYEDAQGGAPQVEWVSAVVSNAANGAITGSLDAELADGVWTIADPVNNGAAVGNVLVVTFNKLLDGSKIQTAAQDFTDPLDAGDCTPAADLGLTVTNAVAGATTATPVANLADDGGFKWYACYVSTSPSPRLGGSIEIFRSETAPGLTAATSPRRTSHFLPATDYVVSGTATDEGGATAPFEVAFKTRIPAPAVEAAVDTATQITVSWERFTLPGADAPVEGVTYTVSRAPGVFSEGDPDTDVDDAWEPGDYAVIEGAGGLDADTFVDNTVTNAGSGANGTTNVYFYQVVASGLSTGAESRPGTAQSEVPEA